MTYVSVCDKCTTSQLSFILGITLFVNEHSISCHNCLNKILDLYKDSIGSQRGESCLKQIR